MRPTPRRPSDTRLTRHSGRWGRCTWSASGAPGTRAVPHTHDWTHHVWPAPSFVEASERATQPQRGPPEKAPNVADIVDVVGVPGASLGATVQDFEEAQRIREAAQAEVAGTAGMDEGMSIEDYLAKVGVKVKQPRGQAAAPAPPAAPAAGAGDPGPAIGATATSTPEPAAAGDLDDVGAGAGDVDQT